MMTRTTQETRHTAGALRPILIGLSAGGISAGLFGSAFGVLGALAGWNLGGIANVAAYFAVWGAISGGLVGMVCAMIGSQAGDPALDDDAVITGTSPIVNSLRSRRYDCPADLVRVQDEFLPTNGSTPPTPDGHRYKLATSQMARLDQLLATRRRPVRGV
jgi:hypothetical protein